MVATGSITQPVSFMGVSGWVWSNSAIRVDEGHITLENFVLKDNASLHINIRALHQLEMSNVSFINNNPDRVSIFFDEGSTSEELVDDVTLTSQPGLKGYEIDQWNGETKIPAGITLTVSPSVTIFSSTRISVEGKIKAIGTPTMPITFTNLSGNFSGIYLNGGEMDVAYANIQSVDEGIIVNNATLNLNCVQFSQNNRGIWVEDWGSSTVNMVNGLFAGNSVAGLQNDHADQIDARYSWWGDTSGPSGIGVGAGDVISGNVSYEPWLTAPVCTYIIPETPDQSTITLDWQPHQNSCGYKLYRSTIPYFSPPAEGMLLANLPASTTSYHDPNSDDDDYFYHVLTTVCVGGEMPANETGIFHFTIIPGE